MLIEERVMCLVRLIKIRYFGVRVLKCVVWLLFRRLSGFLVLVLSMFGFWFGVLMVLL